MKPFANQWPAVRTRRFAARLGPKRIQRRQPQGFTLLEVVLALAILAGAVAVLGELVRSGLQNAQMARDLTRAEMLCEGIEEEVVAGVLSPSGASGPCDDDPRWNYSITSQSPQTGILALQITVVKNVPEGQHAVQFSLSRWMIDPGVAPESNDDTQDSSSTSGGTTSSSSGTSSGGAQ
jgi:general secretion pathway protein I